MTSANEQAIAGSGLAPTDPRESAILTSLGPGAYTAIVTGVDGSQNIALVEVYDLDSVNPPELLNISTRGVVDTSDGVMIAGVIVGGTTPKTVVIRGLGPSLASLGLMGALQDPKLVLYDVSGRPIMTNNDWQDTQAAEIANARLALPNSLEAAILVTLPPGNYTAILSGANAGTGVGLVEVYNITNN